MSFLSHFSQFIFSPASAPQPYVFQHPADFRHYTAQAFVLRCFDDRFYKTFKNFLRGRGFQHLDPASVAGGAKVLASPEQESDRDFILRELEKSIRLHHTSRVMLFTHYDCGAYGGIARFDGNEEKQFAFHQEELRKAATVIRGKFPGLTIETYFMDKGGVVEVK